MTPSEFIGSVQRGRIAPAYLFLGPEVYQRRACRKAIVEAMLPEDQRESGFTRHDLDEMSLAEVLDDARSISLFAPLRVMWVSSAESALPKGRSGAADDERSESKAAGGVELSNYLRDPSPGTTIVFDASRYDFSGEDKAKSERVRKFYSAVAQVVEFTPLDTEGARRMAAQIARASELRISAGAIDLLVEALGADASRIAVEMEKLRLFAGTSREVTEDDISRMVPDARATTIFALVAAVGKSDRRRSLDILNTLVREGEYLPLALSFLATQFRYALASKEAGLRGAGQIQAHFTKQGVAMWRSRAEQIDETARAFSMPRLREAIERIFAADRALRDARPDDRIVVEDLILTLTV
jgi:DNA polymerase-3 subunit delta